MGVSIIVYRDGKKSVNVTPGWRSAMWSMLLDNGLVGLLDSNDISTLEIARDTQRKGVARHPFDWSQDTANSFDKIIKIIRKEGSCVVAGVH